MLTHSRVVQRIVGTPDSIACLLCAATGARPVSVPCRVTLSTRVPHTPMHVAPAVLLTLPCCSCCCAGVGIVVVAAVLSLALGVAFGSPALLATLAGSLVLGVLYSTGALLSSLHSSPLVNVLHSCCQDQPVFVVGGPHMLVWLGSACTMQGCRFGVAKHTLPCKGCTIGCT
jgi:hypothetical protein